MTCDCIFCYQIWSQIFSHLIIKTTLCECVCVCESVWLWHCYPTSQMGKLSLRGIKPAYPNAKNPAFGKSEFQTIFSVSIPRVCYCLIGPRHWELLSVFHFSLWLNFAWFSLGTPTEASALRQISRTHWTVNKVTGGWVQYKFCKLSDFQKKPGKNHRI